MFRRRYNVLVLGCDGMLGHDVYNSLIADSAQKDSVIRKVVGLSRKNGIDLRKRFRLNYFLNSSVHFDYCINCVAHTDTNAAETTEAGKVLDYELNALVPGNIAASCRDFGVKLIHISTDYVFSQHNRGGDIMFKTDDMPFPVGEYGKNKLIGECYVKEAYGSKKKDWCILRTSWLYGMHNNKSFIHKFLKNVVTTACSRPTAEIGMPSDEVSVPTSTDAVITCIKQVIRHKMHGVLHAVPTATASGVSRLQFAQAVLDCLKLPCFKKDDLLGNGVDISSMKLRPTESVGNRPKWSVMSTSFSLEYWNLLLRHFMEKNADDLIAYIRRQLTTIQR